MKKTLIPPPDTIEVCLQMIIDMARRIEQLERHALGGSLKDRAVKYEGPSLFGELDEQAKLAVAKEVERVSKEVGVAAEKRRGEAIAQSKGRGRRPERYYIFGLPVQTKTVYPEGVDLAEYDMIGQDETNVLHFEPQRLWVEKAITLVLRRKGHPCRKGYAWQFRDVSSQPKDICFCYHKGSRAREIPRTQLRGDLGVIQNDGCKVCHEFEKVPGITVPVCMAHIRRKFVHVPKSNPLAVEAAKYIGTLYSLEEHFKAAGATAEGIRSERQRLAVPMLKGLEVWMQTALMTCNLKEPLAVAIKYALSLWSRVMRYTEEGHYYIYSNSVEQGQRPSVPGRKSYIFSQNDRGTEDNAIFYTFMVSCESLGVNARQWLKDTLQQTYKQYICV